MRFPSGSILLRVLAPIVALIAVIALALLILIGEISWNISEDYHRFSLSAHANEIRHILDRAVDELAAARVLGRPELTAAKQRSTAEAVALYWENNSLEGMVIGQDGPVLPLTAGAERVRAAGSVLEPGHFDLSGADGHMHGHVLLFPAWDWRVVTATTAGAPYLARREVRLLLPLVAAGSLLMLAGTALVLRRTVQRPLNRMIADIADGRTVAPTGIAELDTVGRTINESFGQLLKKTEQCQLLHSLAISIHENLSIDDVLKMILARAGVLIDAEMGALALYDEQGHFKNLVSLNIPESLRGRSPRGLGILALARRSAEPLRIDDVAAHPAFSGAFPEGHPDVANLITYPIFDDDGGTAATLFFGNKPGGFTADDEAMLKAVAADASIALSRAQRLSELRRFREAIEAAFDVVIITDGEGNIRYVNPAFERVTGYGHAEVLGRSPDILRSDGGEEFHRTVWNTVRSGGVWRGDFLNRAKDGSLFSSSAVIFPIRTDEGVNFVSIQRDISQEKKLQEQLLRAQKMEAIGTLAGGIAHDFNNLLTGILGYADIILHKTAETDPFRKPATIIHQAAQRGAELAKKILMVTRREKMEVKPMDLNALVRSAVELLQRSFPKDVELELHLAADLPLIKADPSQIHQVVMNLAVNARDAMADRGGKLTIETAVMAPENGHGLPLSAAPGGFVKLSFSDTGMGMDTETQRRIFDPFFTTKETGKGTGLGLYIVHAVVNNHGGYVNLYSEPGKGSRFNIYLPFAPGVAPDPEKERIDLHGTGTILVIDDEQNVRELSRDMLEPLGYTVLTADNGEEGIRLFREHKDGIRLVLLDLVMPKTGGKEVFEALKTIRSDAPVLLCSGYSQNGFAGIDALLRSGALGFVQKPFTIASLAAAIKRALGGSGGA